MAKQPLAEVFGFPVDNLTAEAERYRAHRLCPFHNKVPNCTKDKARDPLGVCSVFGNDHAVITCPVRFREGWIIADDAASFFFPAGVAWTSLTEVRLADKHGRSAGNIDIVLVAYDDRGRVIDFGALEVQAVYISGNVRSPFVYFMENRQVNPEFDWQGHAHYPRPDYLSSSRKRLAPQLIYKGGILNAWRKKIAVAVDRHFFASLPSIAEVPFEQADMAWLVYNLDRQEDRFTLTKDRFVFTQFASSLESITTSEAGPVESFLGHLQSLLDEKLDVGYAPDAPTLFENTED